ncbi:unnamed protein product [Absidia cylindrospora]
MFEKGVRDSETLDKTTYAAIRLNDLVIGTSLEYLYCQTRIDFDRHRYFTTFRVENGEFISCHKQCKMEIYGAGRGKLENIQHEWSNIVSKRTKQLGWVEIFIKMCANLIEEANQVKSSHRGKFFMVFQLD